MPGPLRAFHSRVAARRGAPVAIVAVARKLVVVAWHLLAADADYALSPPLRTAEKRRRLERAAGAARISPPGRGPGGSAERRRIGRAAEQAALVAAEAAYTEQVQVRAQRGRMTSVPSVARRGSGTVTVPSGCW